MVEEAMKTSDIEGVLFTCADVHNKKGRLAASFFATK
jgi:hypothetical protein